MKTSIVLDKELLNAIEGNKSQFVRDAITDRLGSTYSSSSKLNKLLLKRLEAEKVLLLLDVDKLDIKIKITKQHLKLSQT